MTLRFNDHFSSHARIYAAARPDYPEALFTGLAGQLGTRNLAWDCATGTGQAARSLAPHFQRVIASDASSAQLAAASGPDNIRFVHFPAEKPDLEDASVDLITVAQALHWFDVKAFFAAVDRVLKPGGILAVWCYGLTRVETAIDEIIEDYYRRQLGPYWPAERRLVEQCYSDIEFPHSPLAAPDLHMEKTWTRVQMLAYLQSWSATRRYIEEKGVNPLPELEERLRQAWPGVLEKQVSWPLTLILTRK